jgi:hypothetical protein
MTVINIGTNKKNIVGVEIDKPFDEISYADIKQIVEEKYGIPNTIQIQGWCDVTKKPKS